jgi:hypothetical protein
MSAAQLGALALVFLPFVRLISPSAFVLLFWLALVAGLAAIFTH